MENGEPTHSTQYYDGQLRLCIGKWIDVRDEGGRGRKGRMRRGKGKRGLKKKWYWGISIETDRQSCLTIFPAGFSGFLLLAAFSYCEFIQQNVFI